MAVQNRIVKVQKRNRPSSDSMKPAFASHLRAAESIGGFQQDYLPGINNKIFDAYDAKMKSQAFSRTQQWFSQCEPPSPDSEFPAHN